MRGQTLKKSIAAAGLIVLIVFGAGALGSNEEGDFQPVNGMENWDYRFDLSDYEEGKYNLIVRGTDRAGNVAYVGPYNVFIDPASDLPVAGIANPAPGMRVGTDLNVVGTCIDDDAVARVEIRLDDGPFQAAAGSDFWSYTLPVAGLEDGPHVLGVRGIDTRGNTGIPATVTFVLDTKIPLVNITSHANGEIVRGKITLEGWAQDLNGINSLTVKHEENVSSLAGKHDKEEQKDFFSLTLDTEEYADGPQVFWFSATDNTGSTGNYPFLLFVNNEEPALEILSPLADTEISGVFAVTGRVGDKVGLKSLHFTLNNGAPQEIPLTPGNPYWNHTVDVSGHKSGKITLLYTLENLTGNTTTAKLSLAVDAEADLPRIAVRSPQADAIVSGPLIITGFLHDRDLPGRIELAIDGDAPRPLDTGGTFSVLREPPAPGKHTLSITGTDSRGTAGPKQSVSFVQAGPAPLIALTEVTVDGGPRPFSPGITLPGEAKTKLRGEITFSGAAVKAVCALKDNEPKTLTLKKTDTNGRRSFEITPPGDLPVGLITVLIRAVDAFDQAAEYRSFFYNAGHGSGDRFVIYDQRLTGDTIRLADDTPLIGYCTEGAVTAVQLDPATDLVRVEADGPRIKLTAARPGIGEAIRIRITAGGSSISSPAYTFVTDSREPDLTVDFPQPGFWAGSSVRVSGSVADDGEVDALEYSFDGEAYLPLKLQEGEGRLQFEEDLSLTALEEGEVVLHLRAADRAGNVTRRAVPLWKDSVSPKIAFLVPDAEEELNGLVTVAGTVSDAGIVEEISFSDDGENFRTVGSGESFSFDLDLARYETIPEHFFISITDKAGNVTVQKPVFAVNTATDRPRVEIQIPADKETIRNSFTISGMVFDDDQVASVWYRLDEEPFKELAGGSNFRLPVDIHSISDNEHTVEVKAVDLGGVESEVAKSSFFISKSEPASALEVPAIDATVRERIEIKGRSWDPNGIDAVFISIDNGHSFNRMKGNEEWAYLLDTRLLEDGTQAILIKAVDSSGTEGFYTTTINVDNRAPLVSLDTPKDGDVISDTLFMDGRAEDSVGLAGVKVSLFPLDADVEALPLQQSLDAAGGFSLSIPVEELPTGAYNLEVTATDRAQNTFLVSRNIQVRQTVEADRAELIFPPDGASLSGRFNISGRLVSQIPVQNVLVVIDDRIYSPASLNAHNYFSLELEPEALSDGDHRLRIEVLLDGDTKLSSEERNIRYNAAGPWIRLKTVATGDFVTGRPFIEGEAGYYRPDQAVPDKDEDPQGYKEYKESLKGHEVREVSISYDGGKSFRRADGQEQWRHRLETQALPSGTLRLLAKAEFADDTTATVQTMVQVDTRAPRLTVIQPEDGGRYNEAIQLTGTAADSFGLQEVAVALRQGDKSRYTVPKFIQGMYLDSHFMGATYADAGLGLTFFDDNVKLQLQIGMSPSGRFSGLVIGSKLLANIATLPFGYLFGPSWDFFSMSLALGANFSYFTMSEDTVSFTDSGLVLGAMIAQFEFARFQIASWRMFNTYSLYTEAQLWFISSDVSGGTESRISFGARIGLF